MIPKGVTSILDGLAVVSQKNLMETDETTAKMIYRTFDPDDNKTPPSELAKERYGLLPAIERDFGKLMRDELTNHF